MNYIKTFTVAALIFVASCGDDDNGCLTPEEIANSECPAEDLLNVCEPFFCGYEIEVDGEILVVDFFLPPSVDCEAVNCDTLDCGEASTFSNLEIGENGIPSGTTTNILVPGEQILFGCSFF